jgi:hypothetical protein
MPGLGVTDVPFGAAVVADFRTRVIGSFHEQYLVRERERVASSMAAFTVANAVLAAANTTSTWRWFVRNPTGSNVTVALRSMHSIVQHRANTLTSNAPIHTLERWTSTGTASGGTQITPARILSGQAPAVRVYVTAPTGLTNTRGAIAFRVFPSVNLTTTTAQPRAHWPMQQIYSFTDPSIELAPGEALAFRQDEAGTAGEATVRYMLTNMLLEEFTRVTP